MEQTVRGVKALPIKERRDPPPEADIGPEKLAEHIEIQAVHARLTEIVESEPEEWWGVCRMGTKKASVIYRSRISAEHHASAVFAPRYQVRPVRIRFVEEVEDGR